MELICGRFHVWNLAHPSWKAPIKTFLIQSSYFKTTQGAFSCDKITAVLPELDRISSLKDIQKGATAHTSEETTTKKTGCFTKLQECSVGNSAGCLVMKQNVQFGFCLHKHETKILLQSVRGAVVSSFNYIQKLIIISMPTLLKHFFLAESLNFDSEHQLKIILLKTEENFLSWMHDDQFLFKGNFFSCRKPFKG